ncbi:PAS domain-containing protein [Mesorhizobium sp.]|uniref:PAS domain-containing protein n=1 Tax=Mesorhizobium sp. TaxID=1871066 RepID=UPI000FE5AE06|nr:PAS domain-containing protein [Mesorhizobium sp.]RWP04200.1 MAG: PAS domain S-box protein [Mesorhizobium sp.]RWP22660.1 MAG: PAS domain S-box protein [Mesorhizobium sp.]TIL37262.1 MAG: PAS domain S-box protein [Mesorhizobium sp.]
MEINLGRILDSLPSFVWTALPDGRIDFVNGRWSEYTGLGLDEAAGRGWQAAINPDDLPQLIERWQSILASGEPGQMETRIRRYDGQYRWFVVQSSPMRDDAGRILKWYGTNTDIDERKRAQQALAASGRSLKLIVDTIPAMAWSARLDGTAEFFNQHYLDFVGLALEQAQGWGWTAAVHPNDLNGLAAIWQDVLAAGKQGEAEARLRRHDGEYRWFLFRVSPLRDELGNIVKWYGVNTDIEDRKRAEEALRTREVDLRKIIDTIPALAWSAKLDGSAELCNQRYADYTGLSLQQLLGWGFLTAVHPADIPLLRDTWQAILESGRQGEAEARLRRHDGQYRWFMFRATPFRDENGDIVKWYGFNIDIEDRKRAEQAVAASERNLKLIIDTMPAMAWSARTNGTGEFFNQHYVDYVGLSLAEIQDWGWVSAVHPDDLDRLIAVWQATMASGGRGECEARIRRFDGEYRWFLFRVDPLRDETGTIVKWYGVNTDIEDRKCTDEALRESERQLRLIVDTIPGLVAVFASDGEPERLNEQFLEYLGQTFEQFADWATNGTVHPDDLPDHIETLTRSLESGRRIDFETRLRRFDGVYRWFQLRGHPARDADGHIVRWYCLMTDVDDRRRAEDELRRSEAFLADAQRLSRTGSFSWQVGAEEMEWSEETYRIYELDPSATVTFELMRTRVHPENLPTFHEVMRRARREGGDFDYETRLLMPDQSIKHLRVVAHSQRNKDGEIELRGAVQDVTRSRLAEEALAKVRSDLGHVTRIMSLGALTASIAHEVNQPLSGIITNASTCLRMLAAEPPRIEIAQETARRTIRDGNRAAGVIARLRTLFTKRVATIEPVDLNDAVREVIALSSSDLQRGRVILRTELADELPLVGGDRIQLQQVLMNLLRNATDAMSGVEDRPRRIVIRTEPDVEAGIKLSVRDAGIGFGPDGTERIFEAFYTTKSDGMGIGLSVSRSIVETHNGRLWATRNDGPGVTFSFSIPAYIGLGTSINQAGAVEVRAACSAWNAAGSS